MKQWKTNEVERGHTSYSPKTVSKTKIKLDSKNSANGFLLFRNFAFFVTSGTPLEIYFHVFRSHKICSKIVNHMISGYQRFLDLRRHRPPLWSHGYKLYKVYYLNFYLAQNKLDLNYSFGLFLNVWIFYFRIRIIICLRNPVDNPVLVGVIFIVVRNISRHVLARKCFI